MIAFLSGFAFKLCSVLLISGATPFKAVEALERVRGHILGTLVDAKSDISLLHKAYPKIAAWFDYLRTWVNKAFPLDADETNRQGLY